MEHPTTAAVVEDQKKKVITITTTVREDVVVVKRMLRLNPADQEAATAKRIEDRIYSGLFFIVQSPGSD